MTASPPQSPADRSTQRTCLHCTLFTDLPHCPQCGRATVPPVTESASPIGRHVSRWKLTHRIAKGGFGEVWRADHLSEGPRAAVKLMLPERSSEIDAERFRREARVLAEMKHPNIVQLLDFGTTPQGEMYLATELLEGQTVGEVLRDRGKKGELLGVGTSVFVARKTLQALAYAHRRGVVHRDIKPDNLFLCRGFEGDELQLKLIDFGIFKAAQRHDIAHTELTEAGTAPGTVQYMSPEQLQPGSGPAVDGRSDIYAVGVMLYRMLSGQAPIDGKDAYQIAIAHITQKPRALREVVRELPQGLCDVVMKALEKQPDDRFASAADMDKALAAWDTASVESVTQVLQVGQLPAISDRQPLPSRSLMVQVFTRTSTFVKQRPVMAMSSFGAVAMAGFVASVCAGSLGVGARCAWCPNQVWAAATDASYCDCHDDEPVCLCRAPRGSESWCKTCPEARGLNAKAAEYCGCRVARGDTGGSYCDQCGSHDGQRCAASAPSLDACAASRLSKAWCAGCKERSAFTADSSDDCACREAEGQLARGSEAWCRCYPTSGPCDPCVRHARLSAPWCAECAQAKALPSGGKDFCNCFPTDAACIKPTAVAPCSLPRLGKGWCRQCPEAAKQPRGGECYCRYKAGHGGDALCDTYD